MLPRTLRDICAEAEARFGPDGTVRRNWLVYDDNRLDLHGMTSGVDPFPPNDPRREVIATFLINARAEVYCRGVKITKAAADYHARLDMAAIRATNELGPMFNLELSRWVRWTYGHTGRKNRETADWFCKEAMALHGPDGTIHPGFLEVSPP
jgi:hypothetical protein